MLILGVISSKNKFYYSIFTAPFKNLEYAIELLFPLNSLELIGLFTFLFYFS